MSAVVTVVLVACADHDATPKTKWVLYAARLLPEPSAGEPSQGGSNGLMLRSMQRRRAVKKCAL